MRKMFSCWSSQFTDLSKHFRFNLCTSFYFVVLFFQACNLLIWFVDVNSDQIIHVLRRQASLEGLGERRKVGRGSSRELWSWMTWIRGSERFLRTQLNRKINFLVRVLNEKQRKAMKGKGGRVKRRSPDTWERDWFFCSPIPSFLSALITP